MLNFIERVLTTCSAARYGCMPAGPVLGYPGAKYTAPNAAAAAEDNAQLSELRMPPTGEEQGAFDPVELVDQLLKHSSDGVGGGAEDAVGVRLPELTHDCVESWLQAYGREASVAEITGVLLAYAIVRAKAARSNGRGVGPATA